MELICTAVAAALVNIQRRQLFQSDKAATEVIPTPDLFPKHPPYPGGPNKNRKAYRLFL
jgi:hypothetical protein